MEETILKPWHGIGVEVDANLSSREMLYKAKLDWEVSKIPSQRPKSYGNQETIRFFKGFFEAGEADIETIGGLDASRILWGLARLNEDFTLKGEDEVQGYVLLASRDEGREKVEIQFLTVRKSCHNMLKIASNAKPFVKNIFRRTFKPVFPFLNQKTQKFDDEMKQRAYEKQKGICTKCKKHFELEEMDADHIVLWKDGGKTTDDNCQVLCVSCNRGG